jgi:hypothetical protein
MVKIRYPHQYAALDLCIFVSYATTLMLDAIIGTVLNEPGSLVHEFEEIQAKGSYRCN